MKLYLASYSYDYGSRTILGIFESKYLAVEALQKLGYEQDMDDWQSWDRGAADFGDNAHIEEWELNKLDVR